MPRIVVDARGLTFRPSGARTRLLGLVGAYLQLPNPFDLTIVASRDTPAREQLHHLGVDFHQVRMSISVRAAANLRLSGPAFEGADLVHLETFPIPILHPAPLVLTIHDLRSTTDPHFASSRAKRVYERQLLPRTIARTKRVIAVSESTAQSVRTHLDVPAGQVVVVPNAVTLPSGEWTPPRPFPYRYVLAFGHLEPRKNLDLLVDAMQVVADRRTDVGLVLAGRDFGMARHLRDRHERRGCTYPLEVRTEVDDEHRDSLIANAECLALPSRAEGFGIVPLEALALGTPVVAADLPATRETLADGALFADPSDPSSFATAISRLLESQDLRHSMAARGRMVLAKFSWRESAEKLHAVYAEVLAS